MAVLQLVINRVIITTLAVISGRGTTTQFQPHHHRSPLPDGIEFSRIQA